MISFATWLLATAHGVLAGSDSGQAWMQWLYLGSGTAVFFLTLYRILADARAGRSGSAKQHPTHHAP
jgi:hypothetical protein